MRSVSSLQQSQLAGLEVGDGVPVRVMAVLNVSPESFYQGSVQTQLERLVDIAQAMVNAGANIIDVGAMSTAPYLKTAISEEEESERSDTRNKCNRLPRVGSYFSRHQTCRSCSCGTRCRSHDHQRCWRIEVRPSRWLKSLPRPMLESSSWQAKPRRSKVPQCTAFVLRLEDSLQIAAQANITT